MVTLINKYSNLVQKSQKFIIIFSSKLLNKSGILGGSSQSTLSFEMDSPINSIDYLHKYNPYLH